MGEIVADTEGEDMYMQRTPAERLESAREMIRDAKDELNALSEIHHLPGIAYREGAFAYAELTNVLERMDIIKPLLESQRAPVPGSKIPTPNLR